MAARLSPTGTLLRRSRLFSLPPALTPPNPPPTSQWVSESDTATLPFPIRQALETPSSSLARGDWGLKRPLPSKATKLSASPVVRINSLDTYEHITDFESATDHVATLKKFQEMSLPISVTTNTGMSMASGGGRHVSVFERHLDNSFDSTKVKREGSKRHTYRGPWLAGKSELEFQAFLKRIGRKKPEFLQMLRGYLAERHRAKSLKDARDQGREPPSQQANRLTDEEFDESIRHLRANPQVLGPIINEFLDLAPPPPPPNRALVKGQLWASGPSNVASEEYTKSGPPKTHPSAGLSYLRTVAHLTNDPRAGPVTQGRPATARVLAAMNRVRSTTVRALIGVGGIVVDDSNVFSYKEYMGARSSDISRGTIDPDVPGGTKFVAKPARAAVTPEGKIDLKVGRASDISKALFGFAAPPKPLPNQVRGLDRAVPRLDR